MTNEGITLNILASASNLVYELRDNPDAKHPILVENDFINLNIENSFDPINHHSAAAFYNVKTQEVVIAHRGTATKQDWKTDLHLFLSGITDVILTGGMIAGMSFGAYVFSGGFTVTGVIVCGFVVPYAMIRVLELSNLLDFETDADISAIKFTINVLDKLKEDGSFISKIFQTGHSKGGHEAQICTAFLANKIFENTESITFNAPGINAKLKEQYINYNHINIRFAGGYIGLGDSISYFGGEHLGKNIDIHCHDLYINTKKCHELINLIYALEYGKNKISLNTSASSLISDSKKGLTIKYILEYLMSFKKKILKLI